jgi:hypothetical protein
MCMHVIWTEQLVQEKEHFDAVISLEVYFVA